MKGAVFAGLYTRVGTRDMRGLQKGFVASPINWVSGIQEGVTLGIFNYAEDLDGLQVGILNYVKNNPGLFSLMPFFNWGSN